MTQGRWQGLFCLKAPIMLNWQLSWYFLLLQKENMKQFLKKWKHYHLTKLSHSQWTENGCANASTHVHSSIIHKTPKVETAQIAVEGWMDKQIVLYPHNRILFSPKKKCSTSTWMKLKNIVWKHKWKEPDTHTKISCYVTSLMWYMQARQIHRAREQIGGDQRREWGRVETC